MRQIFSGNRCRGFYLPMTLLTRHFFIDVSLVIEEHVFGHIVDFVPGCRAIGIEILMFFLNPGMVGDNIFVTVQAFFHWRNAGKVRIGHIRVAVLTLNLFDSAVNVVAEGNGLLRAQITGLRLVK